MKRVRRIFSTDFHFFSLEDYPTVINLVILGDNGQSLGVDLAPRRAIC